MAMNGEVNSGKNRYAFAAGSAKNLIQGNEKRTSDVLSQVLLVISVPEVGLEPTRPCGHWILNPARLPIPPLRHGRAKARALSAVSWSKVSKS